MGESSRRKKLDPSYGKSIQFKKNAYTLSDNSCRTWDEVYFSAYKKLTESIESAIKDKKRVIIIYPKWKHEHFMEAYINCQNKYPVVFDLFEKGHPDMDNSESIIVSPKDFGFVKT